MISLTIGNSESKIEGLSPAQFKELKDLLSYDLPAQQKYFSRNFNTKRTLLGKDGAFPTGLLYIVERYLSDKNDHYKDLRIVPRSIQNLFIANLPCIPYPEQIEAVDAVQDYQRGIISAPTGLGKSLIIAMIIERLQVPTLIVVPNLSLKNQLVSTLSNIFGAKSVDTVPGKASIIVANIDSIDVTKPIKGYDCVIIDEFHHGAAKTYRKLNKRCWNDIFYRVGLTATPYRNKTEETLLLESILSQVIYKVSYEQAVSKGYIVPVEAYYIEVPNKTISASNSWASVYKSLVVNNFIRNEILHRLLIRFHVNKLSTLCLVKEIQHGEILSYEGAFNFMKGENEDNSTLLSNFNNRKYNVLIGTTGVLGEGVDTKPAEYIIIAGLGKSKPQLMQQIGRGVRTSPGKESCKVILLKDKSHKWSLSHFNEQCKILREEYGIIPGKLDI